MSYDVIITSRAEQEVQQNHDWWAQHHSSEQAARWYDEFLGAALSLENNPERCALAAENPRFPYEIRQLNFGLSGKSSRMGSPRSGNPSFCRPDPSMGCRFASNPSYNSAGSAFVKFPPRR
jgi:hypothetical protein